MLVVEYCYISKDIFTMHNLEELKKLRKPVRDVNSEQKKKLSPIDRLALLITERVGTMGFFFLVTFWTIVWLLWNTVGPVEWRFDPYPAFVLWLFLSNFLQLIFLPIIMVGQNLQGRHAEARAENDFEINLKAEREIESILEHLERQDEKINTILGKLENK